MDTNQVNELFSLLRDIRALLALSLGDTLVALRDQAFRDRGERETAYRLLAEGKSYRKIGEEVGKAHGTIANWVGDWKELGLVDPVTNDCRVPPSMLKINST